jgi:hypothetical protein
MRALWQFLLGYAAARLTQPTEGSSGVYIAKWTKGKSMRAREYFVAILVLAATTAYFVVLDPGYACSVKHGVVGQDIAREYGKSFGGKSGISGTNTSQTGFLVSTSMTLSSPTSFFTNLRGEGKYRFKFSPNVTRIEIKVNRQLMYEGYPIPLLDTAAGKVEVEPHWTGDRMEIEISDQCSFNSFAKSFFR